jgi:hypothetical protein
VVADLVEHGIYCLKLQRSTTPYSQSLDAGGFFRSLKAAMRAGGILGELGEALALVDENHGITATLPAFWSLYNSLLVQYSCLDQFKRLGFGFNRCWDGMFSKVKHLRDACAHLDAPVSEDTESSSSDDDDDAQVINMNAVPRTSRQIAMEGDS